MIPLSYLGDRFRCSSLTRASCLAPFSVSNSYTSSFPPASTRGIYPSSTANQEKLSDPAYPSERACTEAIATHTRVMITNRGLPQTAMIPNRMASSSLPGARFAL